MQILRFSGVILASIEKMVKGLWKAKMNLIRTIVCSRLVCHDQKRGQLWVVLYAPEAIKVI